MAFNVSTTEVIDVNRNIVNAGYVQQTGGQPFWLNPKAITTSFDIPSTHNAMTIGPVTINSGVTVTIPSGTVWTVI